MGEIHNHSTSNKEYESSVSSKYNRRHTPIALDILDAIEMAVERAISKYEKREEEIWEEKSKIIMNAFPDGIQNHRNAHQAMIDAAKAQENFWKELKLDLTPAFAAKPTNARPTSTVSIPQIPFLVRSSFNSFQKFS